MVRRFVKVSEGEIEEVFFFSPSDLVNTKTTIPLRVGKERWIIIYLDASRLIYIHHSSPALRGIVVYCY